MPSDLLLRLWETTGLANFGGIGPLAMMGVGGLLIYLGISRRFEPLLLIPIGFGAILSNIPVADIGGPDGILGYFYSVGVSTGIFPLLIFLGVGALTDFGALIADPKTLILGAAAQFGIFLTLLGSLAMSELVPAIEFSLQDAAAIGIIGGADGPTAIFLASRLSPDLLGAIAVAAYSYMGARAHHSAPDHAGPHHREGTRGGHGRAASGVLRPNASSFRSPFCCSSSFCCPRRSPLIGMLMFGNLLREAGVVERLSQTAQNELINIVTILLGLTVGSRLAAEAFLTAETLGILAIGLVAFAVGTATGVLMGKAMHRLSGGQVNPLIGAAGVSAVPMAARVVNKVGLESNPNNYLLMHAMGPNVAGVIGSAVAAGFLLSMLG